MLYCLFVKRDYDFQWYLLNDIMVRIILRNSNTNLNLSYINLSSSYFKEERKNFITDTILKQISTLNTTPHHNLNIKCRGFVSYLHFIVNGYWEK